MTNAIKLADARDAAEDEIVDVFCFENYDNVIGFVVSQAAEVLGKGLEEIIRRNGISLSPREFVVLNRLHQFGEMSQTQISDASYKDPASTSRIVESLRTKRMVSRKISKVDRRVTYVSLAEKGRAARDIIVPQLADFLRGAVGESTPAELMAALKVLRRVIASGDLDRRKL